MGHHAVEGRQMIGDKGPAFIVPSEANQRPPPIYEHRRRAKDSPVPNALALDLGIEAERRVSRRR